MEHLVDQLMETLSALPEDERIDAINGIKVRLHEVSPFCDEPVDCVQWVRFADVQANDYNPNTVAAPEMKLLERSIEADGYTQPIVAWPEDGKYTVVDGFHRNRVGKESAVVGKRIKGYLPVVGIRATQSDKTDRVAATIRHNRARGKHGITSMTDIITYLAKKNWSDKKIGKELGMDADEVLRFRQIGGLAEAFADHEFSEAWEPL